MSGHSKWATTKHKKAIIDSRRAKVFAKQIRAIEVAARNGGADMEGNPTLFDAVTKAKKSSMPADNIDRAIKRGAGLEAGSPDWGTQVADTWSLIFTNVWWPTLFPSLAIASVAVSINLISDALLEVFEL